MQNAVENGDRFTETEVDKRVAELFLQDFHQCGIHLPLADRHGCQTIVVYAKMYYEHVRVWGWHIFID